MSDSVWPHRRQPPGSPIPGILQARTLEWVAISFSNAWKWKVKVKSLSHLWLLATPWTAAHQTPPSMGFSRQEYWSGMPLPSPLCLSTQSYFLCVVLLLLFPCSFVQGQLIPNPSTTLICKQRLVLLFSRSVVSNSLWLPGPQHARLPCPPSSPRACWNSCPLSRWCHPTISSSVIPHSSCLPSFPAPGSFLMSRYFASCGQSIGAGPSAPVLPMNIQDLFPLEWTGLISLQSKGLLRVFSNTKGQKHQFCSTQSFLSSNSHIHTWLLEKP